MVAGGGASVVYADTISDYGFGKVGTVCDDHRISSLIGHIRRVGLDRAPLTLFAYSIKFTWL